MTSCELNWILKAFAIDLTDLNEGDAALLAGCTDPAPDQKLLPYAVQALVGAAFDVRDPQPFSELPHLLGGHCRRSICGFCLRICGRESAGGSSAEEALVRGEGGEVGRDEGWGAEMEAERGEEDRRVCWGFEDGRRISRVCGGAEEEETSGGTGTETIRRTWRKNRGRHIRLELS